MTNKFKCPTRLWTKFSDKGKAMYNYFYDYTIDSQHDLNAHPKTIFLEKEAWSTICHNMACEAVWALDDIAKF